MLYCLSEIVFTPDIAGGYFGLPIDVERNRLSGAGLDPDEMMICPVLDRKSVV